jgi:hypothetical protein
MGIGDQNNSAARRLDGSLSLDRRGLLAGIAALALGGCRTQNNDNSVAPATGASSPPTVPISGGSFGTIAPGAQWNGAPGSGFAGSPPADPTRITAKPVLHWWQPSQIRGVGPTLIGVIADAKGGISHVDFYVEGAVQANVTETYYTDTDVNGKSRTRPFWGVNIDCATAYAAHPTGVIRVYAKAYPNDATMQARVIGPLTVYPRKVQYDWDKTVNSDGGADFTGPLALQTALRAMHDALKTGGKECGRITITGGAGDYGSGQYEWGSPAAFDGFPWSYGYSCVTAASGVTATLVRGSSFDPHRTGQQTISDAWVMYSYVNNLEFRGSGIVIDRKNFMYIRSDGSVSRPENLEQEKGAQYQTGWFLFNGCKITNSIATWKQSYWNGAMSPGLVISEYSGHDVISWAIGCTLEYPGNMGVTTYSIFNSGNQGLSTIYANPSFIYGDYYANATLENESWYTRTSSSRYAPLDGIKISYNGSHSDAAVNFNFGANTLSLFANGATAFTFQLLNPTTGNPLGDGVTAFTLWSQVANYINGNLGPDWSATLIDDTFTAYQMRDVYGGNFSTSVYGAPLTLQTRWGIHSEYVHWWGGSYENILVWNCTIYNCGFGTSFLDIELTGANFRDVSIKNVTYDTAGGGEGSTGTWLNGHHACFENLTLQERVVVPSGQSDSYSQSTQIVCAQMEPASSYTDLIPTNCVAGKSPPSGHGNIALGSGNTLTDAQWASLFVNRAGKNWAPALGGPLAANLMPVANPRDAQLAARATKDAAGAWRLNGIASNWLF